MRIRNFGSGNEPKPGQKIVYYSASCDLLHPGVIDSMRRAKEQGDFLYVGVWDDEMVRHYRGQCYPLISLQERVLMVLACRFVDEVVVSAPYLVTKDLITSLNIDEVIHVESREDAILPEFRHLDPYEEVKEAGKYKYVKREPEDFDLTLEDIAERVLVQKASFMKKYEKKKSSQDAYYDTKKHVKEV